MFAKVTQEFGLTMSVKKTCIMSLKQFEEICVSNKRIKMTNEVSAHDFDVTIRNGKIETVEDFNYLGCHLWSNQTQHKEIESRLAKASGAFQKLRRVVWYRKCVSISSKIRIFRACVLPVLLYGSETWALTSREERRLNIFYMGCLRTLVGAHTRWSN